jgi:hypothetical protein
MKPDPAAQAGGRPQADKAVRNVIGEQALFNE